MRSRAELYDWELRHVLGRTDQDLAFYRGLAVAAAGPVLELACGTGRVTAPLTAAGVDVTGIDLDPEMLAAARGRGVRSLVCADMRRFALHQRFSLAFVAYNSLQLLVDADDRIACLRHALDHLRAGGVLALELTDFQDGDVDPWVEPEHLATVDGITLHGALFHDTAARVTRYERRYEWRGGVVEDAIELWSPASAAEIEAMLHAAGAADVTCVATEGESSRWTAAPAKSVA